MRALSCKGETPRTVLHLSGSHAFYGPEQAIVNLARFADKSRWRPIIGCLLDARREQSDMLAAARDLGVETIEFHLAGRYHRQGIAQVRSALERRQVSVLHCHGYKSNFYGLRAARGLPIARVATVHGWTAESLPVRLYEELDRRFLLKGFDHLVTVSEALRQGLLKRGYSPDAITVVPNGLDLSRFPFAWGKGAGPLAIPPDNDIIGSVGRLSPEKGHSYLLAAAELVRRRRRRPMLVLVGEGAIESDLREQAEHGGIADRIVFAGWRSDIPAVLAQFDVFVLPSLAEGLPMALLEAMAAGVPVVAAGVGDVPNVVRDGETGLLVPPRDAAALATAILRVLEDRPGAEKRARAARALVEREYSAQAMAVRTEALYGGLPAKPTGGAGSNAREE